MQYTINIWPANPTRTKNKLSYYQIATNHKNYICINLTKNHTRKRSANASAHNNAPSVLHKCMQRIDKNYIFDMNQNNNNSHQYWCKTYLFYNAIHGSHVYICIYIG